MKTKTLTQWLAALFLTVLGTTAFAATNDATLALQKGLFEEEANHDFNAAIHDYQAVIRQFDQDRKLAATAVFRLGECYRKQGNTNDANAQYERIVREFSDQAPLVALSRSYLAAAGQSPTVESATAAPATSEEAEEVRRIRAMIKDSPDLINAPGPGGRTPLHQAAQKGQLVVATFLLDNGAEVNAKDSSGETPLHLATEAGHKAMVELLLDHNADVQAMRANFNSPTALHLAAQAGYRSLLELLLEHKAEVNAKVSGGPMSGGPTPLHLAVFKGFRAIAEVLIRNGADVNAVGYSYPNSLNFSGTPLHIAAQRGDQAMAELLLQNKADPNAKLPDGTTPLHMAASFGNETVAKLLIAHGAEVNAQTSSAWTPLAFAVDHQNVPVAEVLLQAKADPNIPFDMGSSEGHAVQREPLYLAVQKGNLELVRLLLKHGANPNIVDESDRRPPLLVAPGAKDMVSALLDAKADPNIPSAGGETVLHYAVPEPDITEMLLAHGAKANATNDLGETPLHWAAGAGLTNSVELLLSHGAHINARDNAGDTPLHFAVLAGRTEMVDLLLAKGANPNLPNQEGKTPLDWAKNGSGHPYMGYKIGNASFKRPMGTGPVFSMPGITPSSNPQTRTAMTTALESHGALLNLPHLDRIEVSRAANHYSDTVFTQDTNNWNHLHLLDAIGVEFHLLQASPSDNSDVGASKGAWLLDQKLGFPDFAHVTIRKPEPDFKTWHEQHVDVSQVLSTGNCSNNPTLAWGEVVNIPEADHPLNQPWAGFSNAELTNLVKCLSREVEVVIKGNTNTATIGPKVNFATFGRSGGPGSPGLPGLPDPTIVKASLWLRAALRNSGLLLASSDLSRVKVTRHDADGQTHQWVLDCSEGKPAPALWLENGDIIEVPEKP